MTLNQAVAYARAELTKPMIARHFSTPELQAFANITLKTKVIPDLFGAGGFLYLKKLLCAQVGEMTKGSDCYYIELSKLSYDHYEYMIKAWVDKCKITLNGVGADTYLDNTAVFPTPTSPWGENATATMNEIEQCIPVKMSHPEIIYHIRIIDYVKGRMVVLGELEGDMLRIHNLRYEYVAVMYVRKPSDYTTTQTIEIEDDHVMGLLVPSICEMAIRKDKGSVPAAEFRGARRDYLNNLRDRARTKRVMQKRAPGYYYRNFRLR